MTNPNRVEPISDEALAELRDQRTGMWPKNSEECMALVARLDRAEAVIASIERFGTYLDPRHYGDKYDHHTLTRIATEEGKWVAVYRLNDELLATYEADRG